MTLARAKQVSITSGDNGYWLIHMEASDVHSLQLVHHDAISAGTWSLYSTNQDLDDSDVPGVAATPDLAKWSDEGLTIPSPAASAIGSTMLHLSGSGGKLYLVRFLSTADSELSVFPHGKD